MRLNESDQKCFLELKKVGIHWIMTSKEVLCDRRLQNQYRPSIKRMNIPSSSPIGSMEVRVYRELLSKPPSVLKQIIRENDVSCSHVNYSFLDSMSHSELCSYMVYHKIWDKTKYAPIKGYIQNVPNHKLYEMIRPPNMSSEIGTLRKQIFPSRTKQVEVPEVRIVVAPTPEPSVQDDDTAITAATATTSDTTRNVSTEEKRSETLQEVKYLSGDIIPVLDFEPPTQSNEAQKFDADTETDADVEDSNWVCPENTTEEQQHQQPTVVISPIPNQTPILEQSDEKQCIVM